MSYGRAVSARGPALAAVSRAARQKWRRSAVSNEEDVAWRCFFVVRKRRTAGRPATKRSAQCGGTVVFRTHRPPGRARAARRHQRRRGGARGAVEAQNEVSRSPGATQRRQFRSPTTPSAPWAHPGASMRRHGSPIARRRARSRAAEHPKMAARAASAARAGVAEAEKVSPTPNATQGRTFRGATQQKSQHGDAARGLSCSSFGPSCSSWAELQLFSPGCSSSRRVAGIQAELQPL